MGLILKFHANQLSFSLGGEYQARSSLQALLNPLEILTLEKRYTCKMTIT